MNLKRQFQRNRLAEHIMSYLKTNKTLVKTCHVADGSEFFLIVDFFPFLPYSMNKKRRWEMEIGVELVERLVEVNGTFGYDDEEVLVVQRIRKGPYDYQRHYESTLAGQFAIQSISRLSENNRYFEEKHVESVHGQPIDNFLTQMEDINEKKTVIAYHFLETPRNYERLFEKQCISRKSDEWPYTTGWKRIRRQKNLKKWLKFEDFQDKNSADLERFEEESGEFERSESRQFYTLADHFQKPSEKRKNQGNSEDFFFLG